MTHQLMRVVDETRISWAPAKTRVRGPRLVRWLVEKMLRRTVVEVEREVCVRSFHAAAGDSLVHRLHLSQRDLELIYDQRARYLFVGPQAMDELERDVRRLHAMSLGPALDGARYTDGRREWTVFGIEVVYVPWMEGCLLVPEWKK